MSPKITGRPFCHVFLILEALAIIAALSIPLTNPSSLLLNNTLLLPTASPPLTEPTSQNTTSPAVLPQNMFDYHVAGTRLILRITETGLPFTKTAVNTIIDAAIRKVVAKINAGFGAASIEGGRFYMLNKDIDLRITALPDNDFTYFLLGTLSRRRWLFSSPFCFRHPSCESNGRHFSCLLRLFRISSFEFDE